MMRHAAALIMACSFAVGLYGDARPTQATTPATIDELRREGKQVTPPKIVKQILPDFTEKLRKKKITGTVVVSFVVDKNGIPQDLRVESSANPKLEPAALDAVRQWQFQPALVDGQPAAVSMSTEVSFWLY
jgi:TonB family protein